MSNPTNAVADLQSDLAIQTPSGATAFTGVDPIRYDDGLWLESAGTNLVSNPTAVTNTTGWSLSGGGSVFIERVTSLPAPLPEELAGVVTTGFRIYATGTDATFAIAVIGLTLTAVAHTMSGYLYIPTAYTGAAPRVRQQSFTSATGDTLEAANLALRDQWQRPEITFTPDAGDLVGSFAIQIGGTINNGDEFWFACAQAEVGSYASSFILSSLGDGYSSSPSPHSRAASSASVPTAGIISPLAGAIAFRTTPTIETGLEEIWGECGVKGAGTDHLRWGRDASRHPFVEWSSNDAAYQRLTATETVDVDDEHFFYFGHDGTATSLQVDSGTLQTGTRAAVSASFGAGELTLQASAGGVIVSPFATFDRLLTSAEIATLAPRQNWSLGTLNPATGLRFASFQLRPIGA